MRIISAILLVLLVQSYSIAGSPKNELTTYSVSDVLLILENNPEEIIDKEIILSSCGIDVLECCNEDRQAFVLHVDNTDNIKSEEEFREISKKSLFVYGTKRQRSSCKRIGYRRCGLYQGSVQPNPYSTYKSRRPYIFVVSRIIEQENKYLRDILKNNLSDR